MKKTLKINRENITLFDVIELLSFLIETLRIDVEEKDIPEKFKKHFK